MRRARTSRPHPPLFVPGGLPLAVTIGEAQLHDFDDCMPQVSPRTVGKIATSRWRVPVSKSTRIWSRGDVIQIQLMLQAIGVWIHLQTAAYSDGLR